MELVALILTFLGLVAIGIHIAYSLILTTVVGTLLFAGGPSALWHLPGEAFGELNDFVLVAVPLFLLMAQILLHGGVGRDLFNLGAVWLQHLPGGLAIAAVVACAIFSAVSGSSVATALTIGSVAYPELVKRNYPKPIVLGAIAAGGTLGILVPPSIPLILYGSVTGESIGELFTAGIVPGIGLTVLFCIFIALYLRKRLKREPAASWTERWQATRQSIWGLSVPVVVIVGIYAGWFTPTEAAAVGVVMALIITIAIYRRMTLRLIRDALVVTTRDTAMIFLIIIGALLFGRLLTALRVPQEITAAVAEAPVNRWVVLIVILLLLTVMGMFLEVISILLITMPILYPIIIGMGFDPVWFAIIFVITMEMALLTPPVGLNLFVVQGMSRERMGVVVRGTVPFFSTMVFMLILISIFPFIATGLHSFGGNS